MISNKYIGAAISFMAVIIACIVFISFRPPSHHGFLRVVFVNTANGKMISLRDSTYSNAFGERYTINKLKYYVSNFLIPGSKMKKEQDPYHLINASVKDNSFTLKLAQGVYDNINFLVGVDSIRNCSGAQTGGLDPINDMFWTWNSGYVVFKLEGRSLSSNADLNRIEHHLGGFKGLNNVSTKVWIDLPEKKPLVIKNNETTEVFIEVNLDKYWKGATEIKISETPLCTTPGKLSKRLSSNLSNLFSVK